MRRVLRIVRVAALLVAMALLGGCTGRAGSPPPSGGASAPPSAPATPPAVTASPTVAARSGNSGSPKLVDSGMKLVGMPTLGDSSYDRGLPDPIAADGAGMVWFLGPWQLMRLDPASGHVTTWDAEDDRRFASPSVRLAAATGAGVWMLDGAWVRLFDGKRFRVDEQLPAEILNVRGGPSSDGYVYDLVEVGGQLWVSVVDTYTMPDLYPRIASHVVRFADDEWTVMSQPGDLVGGYLAVDSDGSVWDGGQGGSWESDPSMVGATVKRWDGATWTSPGGVTAPAQAGEVVADPTGGVWLLSSGDQGSERLRHFDGTTWRPVNLDGELGAWTPQGRDLAVDQQGWAWLSGARVSHSGRVERLDGRDVAGIVAAGDRIVALDKDQVLLWKSGGFVPVTRREGNVRWGAGGLPLLSAISAKEVWVMPDDDSDELYDSRWYRLRDGEWEDTTAMEGCLARASDGAVWTANGDNGRLIRTTSDGSRTVTSRPVCEYDASIYAGSDGSVWVIVDGDVVQVWPDGRRKSIGRPRTSGSKGHCLHGVDPEGTVWVSEYVDDDDAAEDPCTAGTWHSWDRGRWRAAVHADPFIAGEHVVSGDGTGWALTGGLQTATEFSRYSTGRMKVIAKEPGLRSLAAAPRAGACALALAPRDGRPSLSSVSNLDATAILCFDAKGETARIDVSGMGVEDFSVAPDGAIWVVGPQVARLGRVAALSRG